MHPLAHLVTVASSLSGHVPSSLGGWVFIFTFASFLLFFANAIYQLWFSPLKSVPGPWYAAISDVWFIFRALHAEQPMAIHSLLKKYGPVVRIAPNKVLL
jgi:hypothetical protein